MTGDNNINFILYCHSKKIKYEWDFFYHKISFVEV